VEFAQACVDGDVPVFWTESGDQMTAGLVFRVGRADEVLARGGITHLIEHLALYPLGASARMDYNGQVDAVTTTFMKRGSAQEITDFFTAVCASLRDLPVQRLEAESQVLRTEAEGRSAALSGPLLIERYGAETYGLPACPEFGIGSFQADELRAWTGQHFTRGNAAMWVVGGPPPSVIRLDLPDGPALPAPEPTRSESRTPGWVNAQVPGVGWSGLVRRSTAAQVYARVLNHRLLRELRHKQGLAYSPSVSYSVRDQDMAHVIAASDGLPEVHAVLVSAFIRELERLEAAGITAEELLSTVEELRSSWNTPQGAGARAIGAARNAIMGRPVSYVAAWRDGLAAVSVADVHEVAREAFDSSVFVLPPKKEPFRAGFTALGVPTGTAVAGRRVRSADYPLDRSRLIFGEEGVSLVQGEAVHTVHYTQCAALLQWTDGGRELIGRDGVGIRIEPTLWRLKDEAADLEQKVGAGKSVAMPYRSADKVPHPWARWPARMAGWLLVDPTMAVVTGLIPVAAAFVLVLLLAPGEVAFGAVILVWPTTALAIANARLARVRLLRWAAKRSAGPR